MLEGLSERHFYPGTYIGIMVFTKSGKYGVTVHLSGVELPPAPSLILQVYPSTSSAKNSLVQEAETCISTTTTGIEHVFQIKSRDVFMNSVETIPIFARDVVHNGRFVIIWREA